MAGEEEGEDSTSLDKYMSRSGGRGMGVMLAQAATDPEVVDLISENLLKLFYRERVLGRSGGEKTTATLDKP